MSKVKVKRFKGCSDQDVSDAVLYLSKDVLKAADQPELKKTIISLAIQAWNISLFRVKNNNYDDEVWKKIPEGFPEEYKKILSAFMVNLIKDKQKEFPEIMKGIVSHEISTLDGNIILKVKTLPVKPV